MLKRVGLGIFMCLLMAQAFAAKPVKIVHVMIEPDANRWTFHVTLQYNATGWRDYVDDWRIVDAKGRVLGNRPMWHPYIGDTPYKRTLSNVLIPRGTHIVYIEAHDKQHGWSKDRVRIDMLVARGKRYEIRRP